MTDFIQITIDMEEDINKLSKLAKSIIREHYDPILGTEQNDYMINMFQSVDAIKRQLADGHTFFVVSCNGEYAGYIAYYEKESKLYLDKFYLRKDMRGCGIGRVMFGFLKERAVKGGFPAIFLNVNKHNDDSIAIYERMGFYRLREEKNPIGEGFFMDDYVYQYELV